MELDVKVNGKPACIGNMPEDGMVSTVLTLRDGRKDAKAILHVCSHEHRKEPIPEKTIFFDTELKCGDEITIKITEGLVPTEGTTEEIEKNESATEEMKCMLCDKEKGPHGHIVFAQKGLKICGNCIEVLHDTIQKK